MVISLAFNCLQSQIFVEVESPKLPTKTKFLETCFQNVNSVKRAVKMYSECSVRRVCLMDLLLAPIPPASVGQQTLILSKMAALANLRLSLKLMHPAAHSHSYQAKCQAGRKKRPNSPLKFSGSGFCPKNLLWALFRWSGLNPAKQSELVITFTFNWSPF